jgi:TetR/AcrR family transcriptional repressor of multidrug resistance operon
MRTRDINKEQIVKEQAIQAIVKNGLEGFSMNKLAKICHISVATLYIYYKDKDDLIMKIAVEEGGKMAEAMLANFDVESSFEEGLRVQWENRFRYTMDNPTIAQFFDQLRASSYHEQFMGGVMDKFKHQVSAFMKNIIERGEIEAMPLEAFWSVAYSPLYSLIRFHHEGHSIGGRPFKITDEVLWATFNLVIKALKN